MMGLKERGLRGVLKQLCAMGEIKIGTLKGQDEHGNMYYEGLNYQFGEPLQLFLYDSRTTPMGRVCWMELEI